MVDMTESLAAQILMIDYGTSWDTLPTALQAELVEAVEYGLHEPDVLGLVIADTLMNYVGEGLADADDPDERRDYIAGALAVNAVQLPPDLAAEVERADAQQFAESMAELDRALGGWGDPGDGTIPEPYDPRDLA